MSRFSLRKNAEQTKLSEQKEKSKPLTNPLKTPTKRADSKKGNRNYGAGKDQLQQAAATTTTTTHKSQKPYATTERNEIEARDGNFSMVCSLPLNRLTGIIEKLSIKIPQHYNNDTQTGDVCIAKPNQDPYDEDDNEEKQSVFDDDTSNSKSQDQLMVKTLCLYCDKKFSTCKMQQKHIEKVHSPQKDRRCSVRNSQILISPRSKSAIRQQANRMLSNYPGCTYCKKLKPYESIDPVRDFNGLFLHLTEQHADRYFGCKICVMRFQNVGKLIKHMQIVHNTLPEAQLKLSKDYNDISDEPRTEPTSPADKLSQTQNQQRHARDLESSASNSVLDQTDVIGVEDTILTRLGPTQNRRRMPSNRKGVRLRRESTVSDILLKNDGSMAGTPTNLMSSPTKSRTKATTKSTNVPNDPDAVVFRVPARTDVLSTAFDENFYKEVTGNVRNNLFYHLDGKLDTQSISIVGTELALDSQNKSLPLLLRSTLASTVTLQDSLDSNLQETEIHVATNLPATTAFPTLLTAEQYCGDVRKIRRPHTKHSWRWKWDNVKKYKLINECGKMVKKAKHPMLGTRDLSKLDMWTQLSMRQKHEKQLMLLQNTRNFEDFPSGEKRRLNDQLNAILDSRVLPHISIEQSEQAIIKLEHDEFNFSSTYDRNNEVDDDFYARYIVGQTFSDENFLSMLQLVPRGELRHQERKLVLSGEWARPRCYLCMCCGNKFDKLKSLEEHKMFRHSNIFSTHYEVVGRELLAGNLLQHLFLPKRALSFYVVPGAFNNAAVMGSAKKLIKYRRINLSVEEESSDSVQSVSNGFAATQHTFSLKNVPNITDDCDTDTKATLIGGVNTVSPSHSIQSSFSSSLTATSNQSLPPKSNKEATRNWNCSKCSRKCNGMFDLYRHMLDCSGDYIWSMAKKRKYRYYCGSKKRRPLHRQHSSESRKKKQEKTTKTQLIEHCTTEESSSNSFKTKTPPRPRPSDAESIKKMLENLPPKRVCKTIFPTVNKAKKTKKPKFITKLYNTKILRKTRARQLSNAKRASKAKAQSKKLNSIKCRTRKSTSPKKQSANTLAAPTTDTDSRTGGGINTQIEKRNTPKKEQLSGAVLEQQSHKKDASHEKEANKSNNRQDDETIQNETINKKSTSDQEIAHIIETANVSQDTSNAAVKNIAEATTEVAKINEDQNLLQLNSKTVQQTESNNCNRKRSKRISDCIAMLTGKLEEKLKTETPTKNTRSDDVLENSDAKTLSTDKEKKTPKRKTISRRIIKHDLVADAETTDNAEETALSPPPLPKVKASTVATVLTSTISIATTVTNVKATKEATCTTTTPALLTQTTTTATSKTIPTIISTPNKALAKNIPTTTPPSAPAKIILPPPVTPPALVSIPLPIPTNLHAVPGPLKVLQTHLPVYLPTVQQNINSVLPLTLTNASAPAGVIPPPITLLPPPPLIQAHVSPVLKATSTTPHCAMEPLNLTSSKSAKKQTTAELRAQRPGMPARRQTICGFEARELLAYNDMEPLDLSVKSKPLTIEPSRINVTKPAFAAVDFTSTTQGVSLATSLASPSTITTTLSAKQAEELVIKSSSIIQSTMVTTALPSTLPTTNTDAIFNKQFYSNLELLKIPQIRAAGLLPTVESVNNLSNSITVTPLPLPMALTVVTAPIKETTTQPQPQTQQKANNKKRGSNIKNHLELTPTVNVAASPTIKAKETNISNKRENTAKGKPTPKMNEQVINHIDDAINSVINAVKASLYETEIQEKAAAKVESKREIPLVAEKDEGKKLIENAFNKENNTSPAESVMAIPMTISTIVPELAPVATAVVTTATAVVTAATAVVTTATPAAATTQAIFTLTPKKRNLRSKTLDCRTQLTEILQTLPGRKEKRCSPIIQLPLVESKQQKIVETAIANTKSTYIIQQTLKEDEVVKSILPPTNALEINKTTIPKKDAEKQADKSEKESTKEPNKTVENETEIIAIEEKKIEEPHLQESTNVNLTLEENISNINNTSSGFHSSSTPENGGGVKKKQRRRRKNELAAIVADQLLESFKIDKARRDSLKKLENMAYEKSEDLLLTGMLLMSSTKRTASSNVSFNQNTEKRYENAKQNQKKQHSSNTNTNTNTTARPKSRNKVNNDQNSAPNNVDKSALQEEELPLNPKPNVNDEKIEVTPTRRGRRRQTRRKGVRTPLDNENLSKLKSSLESFSIGIEKQLSEFEARNTTTTTTTTTTTAATTTATMKNNVFTTTESKTRKNALDNQTTTTTKLTTVSSILRPSILSATLEQAHVAALSETKSQKESEKLSESNAKTAATNFSRDPRLNKNIHKDENPPSTTTTNNIATNVNANANVCDIEDDNYLTEIAKNVNEKIMSAENEDFAFADDDGFEIGTEFNDDDNDDSNSKYSRPPTSMSVRSAPNFNDDHSNFGSICDENTNTEVMDMDLDDDLSVYTSFSQDLGRGRGRKRRRRRSILLKRRPKKRRTSHDLITETFECELCKKTFFAATSLAKHNMTLAHVSKVSEREYLLSKSGSGKSNLINDFTNSFPKKQTTPAARRKRAQSMVIERPLDIFDCPSPILVDKVLSPKVVGAREREKDETPSTPVVQTPQLLSMNPDERLFYECCNILKSADTSRLTRAEQDNENQSSFLYPKTFLPPTTNTTSTPIQVAAILNSQSIHENMSNLMQKQTTAEKSLNKTSLVNVSKTQETFKNQVLRPSSFPKITTSTAAVSTNERHIHSPTYSQFSAVTNTTQSRFKTKAAMKGYENGNIDITLQTNEVKSRPTCKLTELADIALGHDDKHETSAVAPRTNQIVIENAKRVVTPEYVTLSVVDGRKDGNFVAIQDNNKKTTETQGSTSSKTIMHSSIIKAAVEEHGKAQTTNKIIIPERPFKNIGLEEKETITFQKPKTTSVNLLMDDNSVSTASYSDRDDFDFNSMSCDEDTSIRTNNEKNLKSNSSESSSSRATAKTFENKSLIMGRIFKNASTKAKATTVKSVGVQKDNTPKADLNQLFDELRGDAGAVKTKNTEESSCKKVAAAIHEEVFPIVQPIQMNISKDMPEPKRKAKAAPKKPKQNKKSQKDLTKLQSELGMSQEEIEKLIDEGQRKSKRRCATNRSKKLVETWSSDEYEEFLSTKDIIALIEEQEKKEQRRKRKSSIGDIKEKSLLPPVAESSTRKSCVLTNPPTETAEKTVDKVQKNVALTSHTKTSRKNAPKEKAEKTRQSSVVKEIATKTKSSAKPTDESTCTSKASGRRGRKPTKNARQTSNPRGHKEQVNKKSVAGKIEMPTATETIASETDDNLYLLDIKRNLNNNNNNSRKNKTKKIKSVKETTKQVIDVNVNSCKPRNRGTESTEETIESKKRNCSSSGGSGLNKKNKGKRKPQTEKSPARKRQAAEKLYYWSSSSSDEDFGRINEHEPEFENTEQYQKHGWIVGDSHKKLVTLLAIAKGNKKQNESCGVKKNVSKRKT